jgi:hypothetical protein
VSSLAKGRGLTAALQSTATDSRILLATALLAPALGYLVGRWPIPSLLVFAALAVLTAAVLSRELALGAILVSSMVMLSVISWFGLPAQAYLLAKALIGLFAMTVMLDLGPSNRLRIPMSLIMLVAVLVVSALVSTSGRFYAFQSLGAYIAAPIAYVAIVHSSITLKSLKRLAWIVVGIAAAQVPIVIAQARFFTANVDQMGGTFGVLGGTHIQAVIMGLAWTVAVALLFGRRRVWLLPVGLAVLVVLLVSEAKAGFIFAAVGTACVGLARAVANPRRGALFLLQYGAIGAAALAALFGGYMYLGNLLPGGETMARYWLAWLANPSNMVDYLFAYDRGQAGRLEGISLVLNQSRTIADLLIGSGLGVLSSSALLGQNAASSSGLGGTLGWATSATRALFETGLLGTALYLVSVGAAARAVVKSWATRTNEFGLAVAAAAVGSAAVYLSAGFYASPWTTDAVAVLFWCLLGMAVKWGNLQPAAEQEVETRPLATSADLETTKRKLGRLR